ncbi:MAG: Asp-tRNA(Asn)/Glu-tRNA(Gln) amidotransferase subunit GatB [Clostridia bacterium]|nr:Asp-tRNA(Asn)/Glu-tRNA(Gln) amidotransferase subunit GatB [Clostridia bacterium]
MRYIPVIGLEIHAELQTASKVFCGCANEFGGAPNDRVCPRCSGLPGTLPVLNKNAVILAARAGIAVDGTVNNYSSFDRKNYFYPDLPKAYQITQFEHPISSGGFIEIGGRKLRIHHLHIEEDAGKLVHDDYECISMADYNRCGVPLIEIVTEPDFRTIEEVQQFVEQMALRLKYAGVCDARMEQGSMRVDVNISIMPEGSDVFGTRAEIKNLNSIKAIGRAIEYEIKRQSEILDAGGQVVQETRRFNDNHGDTKALRSKEEAHDYRYFPEPDIPPVFLSDEEIEEIRAQVPEMPNKRVERYIGEYGLTAEEAALIVSDREFSDFYDKSAAASGCYKKTASLMLVGLNKLLNENPTPVSELKFGTRELSELALLWEENKINSNSAMEILEIMYAHGGTPAEIAGKHGMIMSADSDAAEKAVDKVLAENAKAAQDYKAGNKKLFGFLMGRAIGELGKSANPAVIKEILNKKL